MVMVLLLLLLLLLPLLLLRGVEVTAGRWTSMVGSTRGLGDVGEVGELRGSDRDREGKERANWDTSSTSSLNWTLSGFWSDWLVIAKLSTQRSASCCCGCCLSRPGMVSSRCPNQMWGLDRTKACCGRESSWPITKISSSLLRSGEVSVTEPSSREREATLAGKSCVQPSLATTLTRTSTLSPFLSTTLESGKSCWPCLR
mmetsp:Transcript_42055/g.82609  ORF Transcript_42055/g.82609 Transcript_42055/m.82609 type:complete len:200 (-) Transcript_42055:591-1190(-)